MGSTPIITGSRDGLLMRTSTVYSAVEIVQVERARVKSAVCVCVCVCV